jgi:type IV pilus assembly protein PilX
MQNVQQQKGVVLIVGLMILISLTLLSVGGMNTSVMNERMAANAQIVHQAFQSAESAGTYAMNQSSWMNQTLTYVDDATFDDWTVYDVDLDNTTVSATATLSADKIIVPGYSADNEAGVSYIQLQVDSNAAVHDGVDTRLVQGYVAIGAG